MGDRSEEIMAQIMSVGVSEHDALVIADCIVTRKSCSWVNTDEVSDKLIKDLTHLVEKNGYGIKVAIESVPTRSKYIWEVKVL